MKRIYVLSDERVGVAERPLYRDVVTDATRAHERGSMDHEESMEKPDWRNLVRSRIRRAEQICSGGGVEPFSEHWHAIY